jgi:transcriptional regulator with XRE-family HTH domain
MGIELGRSIEQRRHELGLSRRDLADRSEVSYPYVSQIETGDRDPSLKTLRRLADALQTPVESLAALVPGEVWATTAPMADAMMAPLRSSSPPPHEQAVDRYRDKVLPSVERRLASVPPLARIELLNELIANAVEELRRSGW